MSITREGDTHEVQHGRNKAMVNCKVEKVFIDNDNMLEIVNQTLAV
jgi:hypothetical protein